MATIFPFLTSTYARNVYYYGTTKIADVNIDYKEPVMTYAAKTFYIDDIDNALTRGYITPEEYTHTMEQKVPTDPQYSPAYYQGITTLDAVVESPKADI